MSCSFHRGTTSAERLLRSFLGDCLSIGIPHQQCHLDEFPHLREREQCIQRVLQPADTLAEKTTTSCGWMHDEDLHANLFKCIHMMAGRFLWNLTRELWISSNIIPLVPHVLRCRFLMRDKYRIMRKRVTKLNVLQLKHVLNEVASL